VLDGVLESLPNYFSNELNVRLVVLISLEELHIATNSMAENKSPSLNGLW
jgi:hypothetical protein